MTRDEIKNRLGEIISEASRQVRPGDQKALDALSLLQELLESIEVATPRELNQLEKMIDLAVGVVQ